MARTPSILSLSVCNQSMRLSYSTLQAERLRRARALGYIACEFVILLAGGIDGSDGRLFTDEII